jgi:oxepin-CoA hydrolase/3-oxo-5,6-dehydrosuberyl-CoA semialdehyde dehydrogenase
MGPLVSRNQLDDVTAGIDALAKQATRISGTLQPENLTDVAEGKGFFLEPHLFQVDDPGIAPLVHEREIFGPVVTVMPYENAETLINMCAQGGGSLVSSVYSDDREFARQLLTGLAPYNGRLTHGSSKVAGISPGPGTVLPGLVHGGPGRAGGGEELGGARGLSFYMQRTAIQGYSALLDKFFPN